MVVQDSSIAKFVVDSDHWFLDLEDEERDNILMYCCVHNCSLVLQLGEEEMEIFNPMRDLYFDTGESLGTLANKHTF